MSQTSPINATVNIGSVNYHANLNMNSPLFTLQITSPNNKLYDCPLSSLNKLDTLSSLGNSDTLSSFRNVNDNTLKRSTGLDSYVSSLDKMSNDLSHLSNLNNLTIDLFKIYSNSVSSSTGSQMSSTGPQMCSTGPQMCSTDNESDSSCSFVVEIDLVHNKCKTECDDEHSTSPTDSSENSRSESPESQTTNENNSTTTQSVIVENETEQFESL